MVYRVLVTDEDDEVTLINVLTNRLHSDKDIEEIIVSEIEDFNTDDYYYEYIRL